MTTVTVTQSGTADVVTVATAGPTGPQGPRSLTIHNPLAGDNFTLFRPHVATTISRATAIVSGGSVTYEVRYSSNRQATGALATASEAVTNTTSGQNATIQNQPIPADSWVWIEITAVTGTVEEFSLNVIF